MRRRLSAADARIESQVASSELYVIRNVTGVGFFSSLFGFRLVMVIPPLYHIRLSHLLSNGIVGKYKFWASFLMRHMAGYVVRNWVILRPCITCIIVHYSYSKGEVFLLQARCGPEGG